MFGTELPVDESPNATMFGFGLFVCFSSVFWGIFFNLFMVNCANFRIKTLCKLCFFVLSVPSGVGDFTVSDVSFLPDPCALPEQQKKRSLNEKEKLVYAPLSGVGGIVYDKDAVYIDLGGSHAHEKEEVRECCWLFDFSWKM